MNKQRSVVVGSRVRSKSNGIGTVKGMKFSSHIPFHVEKVQVRWDVSGLTTWVRFADVSV